METSPSLEEASRNRLAKSQSWSNHVSIQNMSKLVAVVSLSFAFACAYIVLAPISNQRVDCSLITTTRSGLSSSNEASFLDSTANYSLSSVLPRFLHHPARTPEASITLDQTSSPVPSATGSTGTTLGNIVFGIGASSQTWEQRHKYIKLWWKPGIMRGYAWLDEPVKNWPDSLPPYRISENTSHFENARMVGPRSAIRISRIVSEAYRLKLPNVHWFVMGDDDTVFVAENLVQVLSKYDHNLFYYIGSNSESHRQSLHFSTEMAFGGGGFAISYALAKSFESMQDACLHRYPTMYGSDQRVHACMTELGVPLTKELGFHQMDIHGDAFGILSAHPLAPLVSMHHLNAIKPLFPNMSQDQAVQHLLKATQVDPAGILQQSICYDRKRSWSLSVSWGYVVQVFRGILPPKELQIPTRTFVSWIEFSDKAFTFKTRPLPNDTCLHPIRFYLENVAYGGNKHSTTIYKRAQATANDCSLEMASHSTLKSIRVVKEKVSAAWFKVRRRQCCRLIDSDTTHLHIYVGSCREGEIIA
ncbi:hypothetical protein O6H91_23G001700 [Diphasiastrum complanatum]|uniref:Uncharacterized protein n=1 Tax=Diphasiastrum complanatum TaxID=34168 RepID=A0ACC2A7G1_DIPCM|nr:hypothetical protein O6H91_23G001700 [Diphasiastrum complanatum]